MTVQSKYKKIISILLTVMMLLSILTIVPLTADAATSGKTGSCTWSFNSSTGKLTISGSGKMADYYSYDAPWEAYAYQIKSIKIGSGVTRIGAEAFEDCKNITSIALPQSVKSVGDSAFDGCKKLKKVTTGTKCKIHRDAFSDCYSLNKLTVPKVMKTVYFDDDSFFGCEGLKIVKTLKVGKTFKLTQDEYDFYPTFKSSNTKVAKVTSSGKITAKSKGTATITVKIHRVSLKCKIKVK